MDSKPTPMSTILPTEAVQSGVASVGEAQTPTSVPSANAIQSSKYWFVEIWLEYRNTFKALVGDTLVFALVISVLSGAHYVLNRSHLPPERAEVIDKIHFYAYLTFLVIIYGGFILKVLAFESKGLAKYR